MADFHKHTATDDFEVITAAGTFLLGASLVDATNDFYVAKVGGTGADFATDIGAALAAFEASVARKAIIFIGTASAAFTTSVTVTKGNVTFIGVVPGAGFNTGASGVDFNLADTDDATVRFVNLAIARTVANTEIDFAASATVILDNCVVSDSAADDLGVFVANGGSAVMRVIARDCSFSTTDTGPDASSIFAGVNISLRLDHCIFADASVDPAPFIRASGNVEFILTNHTIILEPRIVSSTYSVVYDGTSLMTNNGGNSGTETVHGEAGYSTEINGISLSTPIVTRTVGIADALEFFVGKSLYIAPGTYSMSPSAIVNVAAGKTEPVVRGAGIATRIINTTSFGISVGVTKTEFRDMLIEPTLLAGGSATAVLVQATDCHLRNLWIEYNTTGGSFGFAIRAFNTAARTTVQNVTVTQTGNASWIDKVISIENADDCVVRNCSLRLSGQQFDAAIGIALYGDSGVAENNRIVGEAVIAIDATQQDLLRIDGNYINQSGVPAALTTIAIRAESPSGGVGDTQIINNKIQDVVGVGVQVQSTSTAAANNMVIANNDFTGSTSVSIGILVSYRAAPTIVIKGNFIRNAGSMVTGIRVTDTGTALPGSKIYIRSNTIVGIGVGGTGGIEVQIGPTAGQPDSRGPVICDNDIEIGTNSIPAILVEGDVNTFADTRGLKISNNNILMPVATPGDGIDVSNFEKATITGNVIESRGVQSAGVGIDLKDVIDSLVEGNHVDDFLTGLQTDAACADSSYSLNHLKGNATPLSQHASDNSEANLNKTT